MSATGLDVFDKTVQTTNIWLDEIMARLGPDRRLAWHTLGAVLRSLRDRLPLGEAAHLGAQLPLLVRGLYYGEWHPASGIRKDRHLEVFLAHVAEEMNGARPVDIKEAVRAVFRVLDEHIAAGQAQKVASSLPAEIRVLWPRAGETRTTGGSERVGAGGAGGGDGAMLTRSEG